MKHIFFDTNIILDFLINRGPHGKPVLHIFSLQEKKVVKIYTSTYAVLCVQYFLRKIVSADKTREIILRLIDEIEILDTNKNMLLASLSSQMEDYEDAVQVQCALSNRKITHMITRNKKDFKDCPLHICTAKQFTEQFTS
jgi:predicted nucleic acid-binding protein